MKSRLSIIIPTRDRPSLLQRAVESVRSSCNPETNIIVVNDGAELDLATTEQLLANDVLIKNSGQSGAAAARNIGVAAAETEFVAFLDDDDELLPDFDIAVMRDFPKELTFRWVGIEMNCGSPVSLRPPPSSEDTWIVRATAALSAGIGFGVCVRRDELLAIGGFDETLRLVEDTDLFLTMISSGFNPLPVPRCLVRVHSDAGSRQTDTTQHQMRIEEAKLLFAKHERLLQENPSFADQLENGIIWLGRALEDNVNADQK